jgi:hypothetical protein
MTNIFETKAEMPPQDNSRDPLIVRTAQTMSDMHKNYMPAAIPQDRSVENLPPVNRGHHY